MPCFYVNGPMNKEKSFRNNGWVPKFLTRWAMAKYRSWRISLMVFDFNQKVKRIYEKLRFEINEVIETPRLKYIMKRYR